MEDKIIFVLGSGKCGTTSLTHILNCSPDIDARHEAYPNLWEHNRAVYQNECQNSNFTNLYWDSRKALIESMEGKVFGEVNHRSSVFLPGWKNLFPNAKFIVLWRDFDETVVSMARWGCYGRKDVGKLYRVQPEHELEYRKACAWYWVAIYEYILKHLPEDFVVFPLEWLKDRNAEKIQGVFNKLDVGIPEISSINLATATRHNLAKTRRPIEKNWHEFDDRAREITRRLRGYEEC